MLKKIIGLVLFLMIGGCGSNDIERPKFEESQDVFDNGMLTCSAVNSGTMVCTNGSVVPLPADFPYSPDCNECLVTVKDFIANVNCPNGTHFSFPVVKGDKGEIGLPGAKGDKGDTIVGPAGQPGSSCHVKTDKNGNVVLYCDDGSEEVVKTKGCHDCWTFGAKANIVRIPENTQIMPDLKSLPTAATAKTDSFATGSMSWDPGWQSVWSFTNNFEDKEWYGAVFVGFIKIEATLDNKVCFRLTSDDGSKFLLGAQKTEIVSMEQLQSPTSKTGCALLQPGKHEYELHYFQGPKNLVALKLEVSYDNGASYRVVGKDELTYKVQ